MRREELLAQGGIHVDELDEVIERAYRLKLAAEGRMSSQDVAEVGQELDLTPDLIRQAIHELQKEQSESQVQKKKEEQTRIRRNRRVTRVFVPVAVSLFAFVLLLSWVGRSQILEARQSLEFAESQLVNVLDRQAALVPQLAALAGANSSDLELLNKKYLGSEGAESQLELGYELGSAMAKILSGLPDTGTAESAEIRKALVFEVTGSQNRISVERRRYEQARSAYQASKRGLFAKLALAFGLAE